MKFKNLIMFAVFLTFSGCVAKHSDLHSSKDQEMTLGAVQKNVAVGMSQADVATALGSPNIVTKDADGNESWVYDKMATEVSQSSSGNTWNLLLVNTARSKNYAASSQRTLTVVIKFDPSSKVKSVSYHSSRF